ETAAALAGHKDETVERTQAANTLLASSDGTFTAYNTDYQAVLDTLHAFLPTFAHRGEEPGSNVPAPAGPHGAHGLAPARSGPPPAPVGSAWGGDGSTPIASKVVLVLGAGGIAGAVAYALHREGALVTIANRTGERAPALANEVGCRHVEWNARHGVL